MLPRKELTRRDWSTDAALRSGVRWAIRDRAIRLRPGEFDDLLQEAWLAWLERRHLASPDPVSAWFFAARVAKYRTWQTLRRWFQMREGDRLYSQVQRNGPREFPPEIAETLLEAFRLQRKRTGGLRAAQAAWRDVTILVLLWESDPPDAGNRRGPPAVERARNEFIADELGISPHSVRTYRRQIRQRLKALLPETERSIFGGRVLPMDRRTTG